MFNDRDAVMVVHKKQYDKGYMCNPHKNLTGNRILFDYRPFDLVRKINDKEYLVKDPFTTLRTSDLLDIGVI